MKITNDILYVGVNDHQVDLFEGQYVVPNGMAYNSYYMNHSRQFWQEVGTYFPQYEQCRQRFSDYKFLSEE